MIDVGDLKQWRFVHKRATGEYVGMIERVFDWDCSRGENDKGSFTMGLSADYLNDFFADDIIEFRRSTDGGKTFPICDDTCWFVRDCDYIWNNGYETIRLSGHDTTGLLDRRIVAWYSSVTNQEGLNTYGHKSEPAETALFDVFNENFGPGVVGLVGTDVPPSAGGPAASGAPALGATPAERQMLLVGTEGTFDAGTTIDLEISWKNALAVMKDICNTIAKRGILLFFDIVYRPEAATRFVFRVWQKSRGQDMTITPRPVVFSLEHENVGKMGLRKQFSDEVTWVHVGGSGQGSLRVTQGVIADDPAFKRSPFYPIESFIDNNKTADYETLANLGEAELYRKRARYIFSAEAKDGPYTMYGRDYNFGDCVTVKHRGVTAKCRISKVRISLKNGRESLSIPLESNEDLAASVIENPPFPGGTVTIS